MMSTPVHSQHSISPNGGRRVLSCPDPESPSRRADSLARTLHTIEPAWPQTRKLFLKNRRHNAMKSAGWPEIMIASSLAPARPQCGPA